MDQLLGRIAGQPCWSAIVGADDDYPFVLHFGEKRRRSLRLANPRLSFLQRTYEGEFSLLVECAWRVDGPTAVVASCWDPADVRQEALERLVDVTVRTVTAQAPGYDLQLVFENGHALRCLSVETDVDRPRDNWHLYTPDALLKVGPRGRPDVKTTEEARVAFQRLRLSLIDESSDLPARTPRRWPRPAPELDAEPPSSVSPDEPRIAPTAPDAKDPAPPDASAPSARTPPTVVDTEGPADSASRPTVADSARSTDSQTLSDETSVDAPPRPAPLRLAPIRADDDPPV